ncbi:membrane-associated protein, putative, partial [Bodo saltans]
GVTFCNSTTLCWWCSAIGVCHPRNVPCYGTCPAGTNDTAACNISASCRVCSAIGACRLKNETCYASCPEAGHALGAAFCSSTTQCRYCSNSTASGIGVCLLRNTSCYPTCNSATTDVTACTNSTSCKWCGAIGICDVNAASCRPNCVAATNNGSAYCRNATTCQWCSTIGLCDTKTATCYPSCMLATLNSSLCDISENCAWCNSIGVCRANAETCYASCPVASPEGLQLCGNSTKCKWCPTSTSLGFCQNSTGTCWDTCLRASNDVAANVVCSAANTSCQWCAGLQYCTDNAVGASSCHTTCDTIAADNSAICQVNSINVRSCSWCPALFSCVNKSKATTCASSCGVFLGRQAECEAFSACHWCPQHGSGRCKPVKGRSLGYIDWRGEVECETGTVSSSASMLMSTTASYSNDGSESFSQSNVMSRSGSVSVEVSNSWTMSDDPSATQRSASISASSTNVATNTFQTLSFSTSKSAAATSTESTTHTVNVTHTLRSPTSSLSDAVTVSLTPSHTMTAMSASYDTTFSHSNSPTRDSTTSISSTPSGTVSSSPTFSISTTSSTSWSSTWSLTNTKDVSGSVTLSGSLTMTLSSELTVTPTPPPTMSRVLSHSRSFSPTSSKSISRSVSHSRSESQSLSTTQSPSPSSSHTDSPTISIDPCNTTFRDNPTSFVRHIALLNTEQYGTVNSTDSTFLTLNRVELATLRTLRIQIGFNTYLRNFYYNTSMSWFPLPQVSNCIASGFELVNATDFIVRIDYNPDVSLSVGLNDDYFCNMTFSTDIFQCQLMTNFTFNFSAAILVTGTPRVVSASAAQAIGVTSALVALVSSGVALLQQARAQNLASLATCQFSLVDSLGIDQSPLQFGFGSAMQYYNRGCVVGNIALIAAIAALMFLVIMAVSCFIRGNVALYSGTVRKVKRPIIRTTPLIESTTSINVDHEMSSSSNGDASLRSKKIAATSNHNENDATSVDPLREFTLMPPSTLLSNLGVEEEHHFSGGIFLASELVDTAALVPPSSLFLPQEHDRESAATRRPNDLPPTTSSHENADVDWAQLYHETMMALNLDNLALEEEMMMKEDDGAQKKKINGNLSERTFTSSRRETFGESFFRHAALASFPSILSLPACLLFDPTITASVSLIAHPIDDMDTLVGVIGLVVFGGLLVACIIYTMRVARLKAPVRVKLTHPLVGSARMRILRYLFIPSVRYEPRRRRHRFQQKMMSHLLEEFRIPQFFCCDLALCALIASLAGVGISRREFCTELASVGHIVFFAALVWLHPFTVRFAFFLAVVAAGLGVMSAFFTLLSMSTGSLIFGTINQYAEIGMLWISALSAVVVIISVIAFFRARRGAAANTRSSPVAKILQTDRTSTASSVELDPFDVLLEGSTAVASPPAAIRWVRRVIRDPTTGEEADTATSSNNNTSSDDDDDGGATATKRCYQGTTMIDSFGRTDEDRNMIQRRLDVAAAEERRKEDIVSKMALEILVIVSKDEETNRAVIENEEEESLKSLQATAASKKTLVEVHLINDVVWSSLLERQQRADDDSNSEHTVTTMSTATSAIKTQVDRLTNTKMPRRTSLLLHRRIPKEETIDAEMVHHQTFSDDD